MLEQHPLLPWIIFPLVGALIGYATNWLAVKMLFRPRNLVSVGPLKFQGVVPRRQEALADSIAETVHDELISAEDVAELVQKMFCENSRTHQCQCFRYRA